MKFTWNPNKAKKVKADHKVDFEKVSDIFDDPFSADFIDDEHSTVEETRYAVIGKTAEYGLVYLVYMAVSDNEIRFITARKAEKWMISFYEENNARH